MQFGQVMKERILEWYSIQRAKNPGKIIIIAVLIFNLLFFLVAALVIRNLSLSGTERMGLFEAAFYTVTMILDAGCIQFVIGDIGSSGVITAIVCLAIVIVGMISFTGAVVGYMTNYISSFIENSNLGIRKLHISNHFVILNWNTRASEIINDLLYRREKQRVVVLVDGRKKEIEKEINERLADTISRENAELRASYRGLGWFSRNILYIRNKLRNNLVVILREGDVFSSKQLHDLSLEHASSVVILGNDVNNTVCRFGQREHADKMKKGNAQTIKTLMQVADITAADYSDDAQKIIVEVSDDWTGEIVNGIIKCKQVDQKCNIVPIRVHQTLGQILSQFSVMPELNLAYRELFSNKGLTFFTEPVSAGKDTYYIPEYLSTHGSAIPLASLQLHGERFFYYAAESERDVWKEHKLEQSNYHVQLNQNYWMDKKRIIILGHNTKCTGIMEGFRKFANEWRINGSSEKIIQVIVIDNKENLERMDNYRNYPFVSETVAAEIYDKERICKKINEVISKSLGDTSILILSDDSALNEDIDADALTFLVYVQDIIDAKMKSDPTFDPDSIDVVVEITDPKHHDIVNSYSVNNVVISNRYISKMITQIGAKKAIFDFFEDILTYDDIDGEGDSPLYDSKEIYTKKVSDFFAEIPEACNASELIRAIWEASVDPAIPKERRYPTIALGYVKPGGHVVMFGGDQSSIHVELEPQDKLIVYSNH